MKMTFDSQSIIQLCREALGNDKKYKHLHGKNFEWRLILRRNYNMKDEIVLELEEEDV